MLRCRRSLNSGANRTSSPSVVSNAPRLRDRVSSPLSSKALSSSGLLAFGAGHALAHVGLRLHVILVAERFLPPIDGAGLRADQQYVPRRLVGMLQRLGHVVDLLAFAAVVDQAASVEDAIVRAELVVRRVAAFRELH